MAITHTETVTDLIVLNDGTNVVSQVAVKTVSVDDSDPSNLTQTNYDCFVIDSSGGTSAAGFVAYNSLTENIVKGWITDELATSDTKTNAEEWINSVKSPPTASEVNKALPWS